MNSQLLTVVIPTRDRPEWLSCCLQSVFEGQNSTVPVIVSDNSASEHPAMNELKGRYDFCYIRQSGKMSQTEHLNACLNLPPSKWMMLLHDDDELCPNALATIQAFLAGCVDVGIVIGGFQYIDPHGNVTRTVKGKSGTFRDEEGLLKVGIPFQARSPNLIFGVAESRAIGGFPDLRGVSIDLPFACHLAHSYGVAFLNEVIGRYRTGHDDQSINLTSRPYLREFVDSPSATATLLRNLRCSGPTVDKLMDAQTWAIFGWVAPNLIDSDPDFAVELCQKCLSLSPWVGPWQKMVRQRHPILFS